MASHKLGFITASTVSPFLTGKGDSLLKGGIEAAKKIAAERCGLVEINHIFEGNKYTEWGNEHESDAIKRYEEVAFETVTDGQLGITDGWTSCTPDGYVGKGGLVEVKCPYMEMVHMDYALDPVTLRNAYNDQCQFQLMLSGRKWCDLVSYHPYWKDPLDTVIVRIRPDKDWQDRCKSRLAQAEEIIQQTIKQLQEYRL